MKVKFVVFYAFYANVWKQFSLNNQKLSKWIFQKNERKSTFKHEWKQENFHYFDTEFEFL